MRRTLCALALASITTCLLGCAPERGASRTDAEVHRVASRLVAPCCWMQTLDVHESPLASELRAEIRDRIAHGESGQAVRRDLVARFGARIEARPVGAESGDRLAFAFAILLAASTVFVVTIALRWARHARQREPVAAEADDAYDARLDDELARLDDD